MPPSRRRFSCRRCSRSRPSPSAGRRASAQRVARATCLRTGSAAAMKPPPNQFGMTATHTSSLCVTRSRCDRPLPAPCSPSSSWSHAKKTVESLLSLSSRTAPRGRPAQAHFSFSIARQHVVGRARHLRVSLQVRRERVRLLCAPQAQQHVRLERAFASPRAAWRTPRRGPCALVGKRAAASYIARRRRRAAADLVPAVDRRELSRERLRVERVSILGKGRSACRSARAYINVAEASAARGARLAEASRAPNAAVSPSVPSVPRRHLARQAHTRPHSLRATSALTLHTHTRARAPRPHGTHLAVRNAGRGSPSAPSR